MTKDEATQRAIEAIKGQPVEPGAMVGFLPEPYICIFIRYDGDQAVCEAREGVTKKFPRTEIFDVKKLINAANHFLNFGFWHGGMESIIFEVPA